MATKPLPVGTCNVPVNVPLEWRRRLGRLAHESDISACEYIRRLLAPALEEGLIFGPADDRVSVKVMRMGLLLFVLGTYAAAIVQSLDPAHGDDMRRSSTSVRVVRGGRVLRGVRRAREDAPWEALLA